MALPKNAGKVFSALFLISACQGPNIENLSQNAKVFLNDRLQSGKKVLGQNKKNIGQEAPSLQQMLDNSLADANLQIDFKTALKTAVDGHPRTVAARESLKAKMAAVDSAEAQKNFKVRASIYGGVEDISDKQQGVALVVDASRLLFDGGRMDATISSESFSAKSAMYDLNAILDDRALKVAEVWIDLEKSQALNSLIDQRMRVLDPLITQLEKVAQAGVGDVSKVAAAQRTVATIRVAQTDVVNGLKQARLKFINEFGALPNLIDYDSAFISNLVPSQVSEQMILDAPLLLMYYSSYRAASLKVAAAEAKDKFNVGLEARASRPFGGSGYDSDESIGLVARKTIFNGGLFESEVAQAKAMAESNASKLEATYREGERTIRMAQQTIASMDTAIELARKNAKITADEIAYLRQQLVIGGSTLDSVLSAEARLYDAESKEINFIASRRKAEVTIASALGLLAPALGLLEK